MYDVTRLGCASNVYNSAVYHRQGRLVATQVEHQIIFLSTNVAEDAKTFFANTGKSAIKEQLERRGPLKGRDSKVTVFFYR